MDIKINEEDIPLRHVMRNGYCGMDGSQSHVFTEFAACRQ